MKTILSTEAARCLFNGKIPQGLSQHALSPRTSTDRFEPGESFEHSTPSLVSGPSVAHLDACRESVPATTSKSSGLKGLLHGGIGLAALTAFSTGPAVLACLAMQVPISLEKVSLGAMALGGSILMGQGLKSLAPLGLAMVGYINGADPLGPGRTSRNLTSVACFSAALGGLGYGLQAALKLL
jgi:hypothetical protein